MPAVLLAAALAAAGSTFSVTDAIRAAFATHAGLRAGDAAVRAAQSDERSASDRRWPTLELHARAVATDQPVAAFGLKLDEGRITQQDFDPARLSSPDPVGGVGAGASITQVLYAGGRIDAAIRAGRAQASAEALSQERRRQEVALAVVEAYFSALLAEQGVHWADDALSHARETERFVRARAAEQQLAEAEALRATAARAEAEAGRALAAQQLASARSALELLTGEPVAERTLSSAPDDAAEDLPARAPSRPDLQAAQQRVEAALAAGEAASGTLLPEIFAQASADTMRSGFSQGRAWWSAAIGARWQLALPGLRDARSAQLRAEAAAAELRWQRQRAQREVDEARRALHTSRSRIAAAREAVAAGESARTLRDARHRSGLLPLADVLDAASALSGARTLLLKSRLEARVARARLQLATGMPVEGVEP